MDRGAWRPRVPGVSEELDMTEHARTGQFILVYSALPGATDSRRERTPVLN